MGQWLAGFESWLVPDLPLPFIPTLIGLLTLRQVLSGGRQWQIHSNPVKHHLKINFVSHPLHMEGLSNCIQTYIIALKYIHSETEVWLVDQLILMACQLVSGYLMPPAKGITFILHSYLHFLYSLNSFFFVFVLHRVQNQIPIIFKQIYLTHRWDPNRYYHSRSEWNRN